MISHSNPMKLLTCLAAAFSLTFSLSPAQEGGNPALAALEAKVLYHPRPYEGDAITRFEKEGGQRVNYTTPQGKQSAWLIPADGGKAPERLWLIFGGNGALALEMAPVCRSFGFKRDAWLLVDYPGYGVCEGKPGPQAIRENVKSSCAAALPLLGIDQSKLHGKVLVFGHSLGCAAALMAAEEFQAPGAVLCAPFTSTEDMARQVLGVPAGIALTHVFDNRKGIEAVKKAKGRVWILHGKQDEVIPAAMSEALAKEFRETVKLDLVEGAHHNDLFEVAQKQLQAAMAAARK